jgi:hypothetical protein
MYTYVLYIYVLFINMFYIYICMYIYILHIHTCAADQSRTQISTTNHSQTLPGGGTVDDGPRRVRRGASEVGKVCRVAAAGSLAQSADEEEVG